MKPSELVLRDFCLEIYCLFGASPETWVKDYRIVRAYDQAEAINKMREYMRLEGISVGGVTVKV